MNVSKKSIYSFMSAHSFLNLQTPQYITLINTISERSKNKKLIKRAVFNIGNEHVDTDGGLFFKNISPPEKYNTIIEITDKNIYSISKYEILKLKTKKILGVNKN